MCSSCRRSTLAAWRTWDERRVCGACIRRALREADRVESERVVRDTLERFRRLGFR